MFDLLNTFPHESEVESPVQSSPAQSSPARGSHMPRTVNVLENSLYEEQSTFLNQEKLLVFCDLC